MDRMEMPLQTEDWQRALQCTVLLHRWGHLKDNQDLNFECGSELHTIQHLLQCPLLKQVCTAKKLATNNDTAQKYVQDWPNRI